DLHALGQGRPDLCNLRFDALNDVQGVLSMAHDDDPAHRVAFAVQIDDASANVRPQDHFSQILNQDRGPGFVGPHDDVSDVLRGFGIASPADHVFGAGKFNQPPSHVV